LTLPSNTKKHRKTVFTVRNINYPVVSKEDLIKMKEASNRHHDVDDIKKLKILIDLEQENK
jgi:hypothetical protein